MVHAESHAPVGLRHKNDRSSDRRFRSSDLAARKLFTEILPESLQFLLREWIYRAEWWIRALDQLNLMVVLRMTLDFASCRLCWDLRGVKLSPCCTKALLRHGEMYVSVHCSLVIGSRTVCMVLLMFDGNLSCCLFIVESAPPRVSTSQIGSGLVALDAGLRGTG
jgi:hypothetical protein